jgi:hypothetical protein
MVFRLNKITPHVDELTHEIKSVKIYLGPVIRNRSYKCDEYTAYACSGIQPETVKIDDMKLGSIYFLRNCL